MNGEHGNFWRRPQKLLLCAGGALLLAGCVELPKVEPYANAPVDPNSAAAAEVARAADNPGPYPRFEDIPPIPTDLRSNAEWRQAVQSIEGDRETLLAETAPSTFALQDTDAFSARAQTDIDIRPGDVPTDAEMAESAAFARAMRERATPPPRPR